MKNESNESTVKTSRDLLKEKFRLIKNDKQIEPRKKPRPQVKIVIDELPPASSPDPLPITARALIQRAQRY